MARRGRSFRLAWRGAPAQFFGGVQIVTVAVTLWALFAAGAGAEWWVLAGLCYFLYGCVGLSIGFHRYFAHRSFTAPRWAGAMFHMLGIMGCFGTAAGWVGVHRRHHAHADREGDPHSVGVLGWRALLVGSYDGRVQAKEIRRAVRGDRFGVVGASSLSAVGGGLAGSSDFSGLASCGVRLGCSRGADALRERARDHGLPSLGEPAPRHGRQQPEHCRRGPAHLGGGLAQQPSRPARERGVPSGARPGGASAQAGGAGALRPGAGKRRRPSRSVGT